MELTPKQQTSEAIRQAQTILITSGQHPSMDQVAAVISLAMILRKFGKKVSAVISDSLPQAASLLETATVEKAMSGLRDFVLKVDVTRAEVDKLRYEVQDGKLNIFLTPFKGNFAPSDVTFDYGQAQLEYDLAIILGVPTRARVDRIYEQNQAVFANMPVINLDFHRSNENYGAINLIEPNASSLCEMLVALSESLQSGIVDAEIATALLMGIVASTDRFTASHTTSKSLTVAAQMMAAGARQQAVVRALYRDGRGERDQSRSDGPRSNDGSRSSEGANRTERSNGGERDRQGAQPAREPQLGRESGREEAVVGAGPAVMSAGSAVMPATAPVAEATSAPKGPGSVSASVGDNSVSGSTTVSETAAPVAASGDPATGAAAPATQVATVSETETVPVAATPAEAPVLASAVEPASVVPTAPVAEPVHDLRPFRGTDEELPIIDPSHIEVSDSAE